MLNSRTQGIFIENIGTVLKKASIFFSFLAIIVPLSILFLAHPVHAAPVVTDSFTGPAGTGLTSHSADSGESWHKNTFNNPTTQEFVITDANRIRTRIGTAINYIAWNSTTTDYSVSAKIYRAGNPLGVQMVGVGGRIGESSFTGYYALLTQTPRSSSIELYRGGNPKPLGRVTNIIINVGETHEIRLDMIGYNIQVYWDNHLRINKVVTGADIVDTPGRPGVYGEGSTNNSNTVGLHIDDFSVSDDTNRFRANTLSRIFQADDSVTLSWLSATGGTPPATTQLQRSISGANIWVDAGGAITSPYIDTGLAPGTNYDYRVRYTDAAGEIIYSNVLKVAIGNNLPLGLYGTAVKSQQSLLYYWPMTDPVGSTSLVSAAGNVDINLVNGAAAGSTGQTDGTAASFDGINDYAVTASEIDLSMHDKVVVEGLLNYDFKSSGSIGWELTPNTNSNRDSFAFMPVEPSSPDHFNLLIRGDGGYTYRFFDRPSANNWHHIVAIYDKGAAPLSEVKLYVDGVLQVNEPGGMDSINTNNFAKDLFYIMSRGGNAYFTQGKLQHLAIYSDLDANTILDHYRLAFYGNNMMPGTLSELSHNSSSATLSWTSAAGGASPINAQLQKSNSGANNWVDIVGATSSPYTDIGLVTGATYDYRVKFTDSVSDVGYSNIIAVTAVPGNMTYTIQQNDLWDNIYSNADTPRQSPFARFVFNTDADQIIINGSTELRSSFPQYANLWLRVDGIDWGPIDFSQNGPEDFHISLGSAGTMKAVEVITGLQSTAGTASPRGSFINSISYLDTALFQVQAPNNFNDRVLFYGDSISVGGNTDYPQHEAYVPLLRNIYGFNTVLEGWGYRALYDDVLNSTVRDNFISHLSSSNPKTVWLAIGTNDYGLSKWSANNFGIAYGDVLDRFHAQSPNTRIYCQTPIIRSSEDSTNGHGNTLEDYRIQIKSACDARSNFAKTIDGKAFLATQDLDDGVHPTPAGFIKYTDRIAAILMSPSYSVLGPHSGQVTDTSADFVVTTSGGSMFMGDQMITISDGGAGGFFTTSLGGFGMGSITVTPDNGDSSFTFTYQPASTGIKTLTFSNHNDWNDPQVFLYDVLGINPSVPGENPDATVGEVSRPGLPYNLAYGSLFLPSVYSDTLDHLNDDVLSDRQGAPDTGSITNNIGLADRPPVSSSIDSTQKNKIWYSLTILIGIVLVCYSLRLILIARRKVEGRYFIGISLLFIGVVLLGLGVYGYL